MTPAPAASEAEPGLAASSSFPSASERIRQKRAGIHGPEHPVVSESVQTSASSPDVVMGDAVSPAPASSSGTHGPGEAPAQERLKRVDTDEEMRTGESDVKKPRVAAIGALTVFELAVCEDGYDQSFDSAWDPIPKRSARCDAKCHDHGHRCPLREGHFKSCVCRRCLISHTGHLTADSADQEKDIMDVSGELHEHEQWEPEKIHYDCYSGEKLDEDLCQKGRDDELRAMQDYGVYVEIPIREAVGVNTSVDSHSSRESRQGEMAFCGHRGEHRVSEGQSPGHATTDESASNHQSCRFVSHFRWSSHENDSFVGCQESVF